jgi:hypothetical protein
VAPERATFLAREPALQRRSATVVLVRETGFVVLYLESIGGEAETFDDLALRLSAACAAPRDGS